jgi:hypothetical protein
MRVALHSRHIILAAAASAFAVSCTVIVPARPMGPAGTFVGETADHRPVRLTLRRAASGYVGSGDLDGQSLSLSFLEGVRGTGLAAVNDRLLVLEAELSYDGDRLSLELEGETVAELRRGGAARAPSGGKLAGRYVAGGSRDYIGEMTLAQDGRLVFGTGLLFGQRFAVAGIADDAGEIRGRALYADGGEAALSATLTDGGRRLLVFGLGVPLEMVRRSRGGAS